jgi:formylmethanofuran dehydrogenase subunit D
MNDRKNNMKQKKQTKKYHKKRYNLDTICLAETDVSKLKRKKGDFVSR